MEALAARPLQNQQPDQINHEVRNRIDTITWLAETLDGNMRTEFEFSVDGQELRGEDGGSLTEVFDNAIRSAELIIRQNPGLFFELRRRLIERGELDDMGAMSRGELLTDDGQVANTIVVMSDFPPELMGAQEDIGGYNSRRKQTMMRVITLEDNGSIKVTTQSLDLSNRQALEAVYGALDQQPEDGELLSQRVNLRLSAEQQAGLADNLTDVHDASLVEQFGGEWYAGRRPAEYNNTYDFARQQQDLVDLFTAKKLADPEGAEKSRYEVAATATARYERFLKRQAGMKFEPGEVKHQALVSAGAIAATQNLARELEREGRRAAGRGRVFNGCGVSVKAEADKLSTGEQLQTAGYGNKSKASSEDDDCEFISKECPECGEKNVKTKVSKIKEGGKDKKHIEGDCGCSVTV